MPVEVQIPKLGLTMREGTVARWMAAEGQQLSVGDAVFELTTDKVQTEISAEAAGILHQAVSEGTVLAVGAVAGWLLAPGEAPPSGGPTPEDANGGAQAAPKPGASPIPSAASPSVSNGRILASPNARRIASLKAVDLRGVVGTGPGGRIVSADVEEAVQSQHAVQPTAPGTVTTPAPSATAEVLASPLARRLSLQLGVDLQQLAGSGPAGRVTVDDVVAAAGRVASSSPAGGRAKDGSGQETAVGGFQPGDRIPLRGMRGIIAERMHASLQEMAQLTLTTEARVDALMALRERLREEWPPAGLPLPGVTDLVIKAAAVALRRHPLLNAMVADAEIQLLSDVHIGVAVALDDGLLVPVVRHADLLPVADLGAETTRLAAAARDGRLQLDELEGHTFSVTSLGAQGIDAFTPVINAPDVAILGIGRIRDTVSWSDDRPVKARVMTLSLTIDHRAVDGAPGAAFLRSVVEHLEAPMRLLA